MSDGWIGEQEQLERLSYEIFQKINGRNQLPKFGVQYSRIEAQVTSMKRSFDDKIASLQQQLVQSAGRNAVTRSEAERRQRLLDALSTKSKQMETALRNTSGRSALLGADAPGNSRGGSSWVDDDDVQPAPAVTNDDMRQQQQHMFREQDRGLEVLDTIIIRQKALARGIGTEIDIQNEIIDDIGDNMDQTNERLLRNTRNIQKISYKSETCCYWVIIIILFIANLVVLFI